MSFAQRTFVVGVDASEDADRALQWTRDAAGPDDRIVAVHAWDLATLVGVDSATSVPAVELGDLAKQGLAEMVERQDDPRIEGVTHQGHAGRGIVEEANHQGADAVVVGHRGSGRASLILGSTANHVIHHTELPVVVVRGDRDAPPGHVVIGTDDDLDGDDSVSVRALRWAYTLAGVRVIDVAHSWFVPSVAAGRFSNPGADFAEQDQAAVAIAQRVIDAAGEAPEGVSVRARPLNGTPEFALIEASRDADLVVVGSRGRGGFTGLILGSTSLDLASHGHCPIAILR